MFIQATLFLNITITCLFGHLIFISKSFALQNSPLKHLKYFNYLLNHNRINYLLIIAVNYTIL